MSKQKNPEKRLGPTSLAPLSVDDALRGAMEVNPPKEAKPKAKRKKARKASTKKKRKK